MRIFKQTNNFDCGIAVTRALIYYFHHTDISHEQLVSEAKLSRQGLSILDLEALNLKYDIHLHAYHVNWKLFLEYPNNQYCILLLQFDFGKHYVIVKKHAHGVVLYDSWLGKQFWTFDQLNYHFCEIVIEFNYQKPTSQFIIAPQLRLQVNYFYVVINIVINLIAVILTALLGFLMRNLFSHVVHSQAVNNLITIGIMGLFIGLSIGLSHWLSGLMQTRLQAHYLKQLSYQLSTALSEKRADFWNKIANEQFLMLDWHINNIAKFYADYYHQFYVQLANLLILLTLIAYFQWQILILVLVGLIIQVGYNYFNYYYHKRYFGAWKQLSENNKRNLFSLEQFFSHEFNQNKKLSLIHTYKTNVSEQALMGMKINYVQNSADKLNQVLGQLLNLALYVWGAYLLISNSTSYGNIISSVTFFSYANYAASWLIRFSLFYVDFNYSLKIYLSFCNCANVVHSGLSWTTLKHIELKNLTFSYQNHNLFTNLNYLLQPNTFISGRSGSGKSSLFQLLTQQLHPDLGTIHFNDINIQQLNSQEWIDHVIYLKSLGTLPEQYQWEQLLSPLIHNERANVIQLANMINLSMVDNTPASSLSSGQIQFINLLMLLNCHDQLIILDEATSHLDVDVRHLVYQTIIPKIAQNNFLICTEHDHSVVQYFDHHWNLNSV